jgi:sigma-E processing peptidase SpoIIGA
MAVTVYVEIVVLNNLIIDLLLAITTIFSRRRKLRKIRIFASSIIGAVASIAYLFMPAVIQTVIKIFLAPLITLIFDKYSSVKDYLTSLALFMIFTFVLGGTVYGLCSLTGIDLRSYAVLGVLVGSILILESVIWLVIVKKPSQAKSFFDVAVTYHGKVLWLKGFYDSGNSLIDDLTGLPVILLTNSAIKMLKELGDIKYDGYVQVKTINGESTMPIIAFDEIRCGQSVYHGYGAITNADNKDCDLILQNTLVYT